MVQFVKKLLYEMCNSIIAWINSQIPPACGLIVNFGYDVLYLTAALTETHMNKTAEESNRGKERMGRMQIRIYWASGNSGPGDAKAL